MWLILSALLATAAALPATAPRNPEEGDYFQGDIVLENDETPRAGLFNAIIDKSRRWPNGELPYTISSDFDDITADAIEEGVRTLNELTRVNGRQCINLFPRTVEADYVSVQRLSGCFSSIGQVGGGQRLSIGFGCERIGTIMHEFLHALGFYHEQSRGDRDEFVTINFDNIRSGTERNFRKLINGVSVDHQGTSYDYGSVLHYGAYAFAVDRSIPTIIPADPNATIGQRERLSAIDIERVQLLYGCLSLDEAKYHKRMPN